MEVQLSLPPKMVGPSVLDLSVLQQRKATAHATIIAAWCVYRGETVRDGRPKLFVQNPSEMYEKPW